MLARNMLNCRLNFLDQSPFRQLVASVSFSVRLTSSLIVQNVAAPVANSFIDALYALVHLHL